MKYPLLLTFLIILFHPLCWGQEDPSIPTGDNLLMNLDPPKSPEAAGLGKYGTFEASLYTGTPNINVPLWNISTKDIDIPISLDYDASGVKVSQMASWAGLGWTVTGSGVINRQANGKPDDALYSNHYFPYYHNTVKSKMSFYETTFVGELTSLPQGQLFQYYDFKKKMNKGLYETQPDVYSYNALGILSGKFFIDYELERAVSFDNPDVKIVPHLSPSGNYRVLDSFDIIDLKGNKFSFTNQEITHSKTVQVISEGFDESVVVDHISSWHLSQVITAVSKDTIQFTYHDPVHWTQDQRYGSRESATNTISFMSQIQYGGYDTESTEFSLQSAFPPEYRVDQMFLNEIIVNGNIRAKYFLANGRLDIENGKYLDRIEFYNYKGNLVRKVDLLNNGYFRENSSGSNTATELRLKLDGIEIVDYDGNGTASSKPSPYTFSYYQKFSGQDFVPDRLSYAQDYWGYYNGEDNNTTLVPEMTLLDGTTEYYLEGADRNADINNAKLGTLHKIEFPTGGYTTFDYDLHMYGYEDVVGANWEEIVTSEGGLVAQHIPDINFQDDACSANPNLPKMEIGSFSVDNNQSTKRFRILTQFNNDGTSEPCQHYSALVIYPAANNNPDFPTFKTDPSSRFYFDEMISSPQEFEVSLSDGNYKYLILNNSDKYTYTFEKVTDETYDPQPQFGGGLRIDQIKSFDSSDELVSHKQYYYDNYLNALSNPDFHLASSAILQQPLDFSEVVGSKEYGIFPYMCEIYENYLLKLHRYSFNRASIGTAPITYGTVSEILYDVDTGSRAPNGFTVTDFYNNYDYMYHSPYRYQEFLNGQKREIRTYSESRDLISSKSYHYEVVESGEVGIYAPSETLLETWQGCLIATEDSSNPNNERLLYKQPSAWDNFGDCVMVKCSNMPSVFIPIYWYNTSWHERNETYVDIYYKRLVQIKTTENFLNGNLQNIEQFSYENPAHSLVTRTDMTDSQGNVHLTEIEYPLDISSPSAAIQQLIDDHRIAVPISVTTTVNGSEARTQRTFKIEGGLVLPWKVEKLKNGVSTEVISYDDYDARGNLLQSSRRAGTNNTIAQKTSYLWGYGGEYMVAQVQDASLTQVIATPNFNYGNLPNLTGSALRSEVQKVRDHLTKAMVSTFTFLPEIGLTSQTAPDGRSTFYFYDGPNHLIRVEDEEGNILNEYEYHYQTNN